MPAAATIEIPARPSAAARTETTSALGVNIDTDSGGSTYYRRDDQGQLVSTKRASGAIHYFAFDSIGSVTELINQSGATVQSYSYDPYGNTTVNVGTGPSNPWRYAGTYQDPTGFYKMGARYYRPELMRWTQQDPLEGPDNFEQLNRYAYAAGDPIDRVDPSGKFSIGRSAVAGVASAFFFVSRGSGRETAAAALTGCLVGGKYRPGGRERPPGCPPSAVAFGTCDPDTYNPYY